MLRIWKAWRGNAEVENLLRQSMPRPSDAFLEALPDRVRPQARRRGWPRVRVAAALAILTVSLAAFAGFGALGHAASEVSSSVSALTGAFTASGPHIAQGDTPAGDQYGTPVTITSVQSLTLRDSATVTGIDPTGKVTFSLYEPGDTNCQTPIFTVMADLAGGTATTPTPDHPSQTVSAPGTYRWTAHYGGDANDEPSDSPCGAETLTLTNG